MLHRVNDLRAFGRRPCPEPVELARPHKCSVPQSVQPTAPLPPETSFCSLELSSICNEIHTRHRTPQQSNKQITFHACFASLFGEKGEHFIGVRGEFYTPCRSSAGPPPAALLRTSSRLNCRALIRATQLNDVTRLFIRSSRHQRNDIRHVVVRRCVRVSKPDGVRAHVDVPRAADVRDTSPKASYTDGKWARARTGGRYTRLIGYSNYFDWEAASMP